MQPRRRCVDIYNNTANVAALSQVQSAWIDITKHTPMLDALKTSTNGTYVLELDWSRDGGSTTLTTDTVSIVEGVRLDITSKARWVRVRVKNTHATNAFTAHSTNVAMDSGVGN